MEVKDYADDEISKFSRSGSYGRYGVSHAAKED